MKLVDADECYKHLLLRVFDTWNDFWQVANTLAALPTIEAEPVKYGKWEFGKRREEFVEAECTACGGVLLVKWYSELSVYKYCPNCGARMDGEQE